MLVKPDYSNSIVNLMSSIVQSSGVNSPYSPLEILPPNDLEDIDNILLIAIDGLGYNYLKKTGSQTFMKHHLKDSITSVFPPSTGSAMSSIYIGLAPQQHTLVGWWVYLREYGIVSRILPFSNVVDYNVFGTNIAHVIDTNPLPPSMNRDNHIFLRKQIVDSTFTRHVVQSANRVGYTDIDDFFQSIKRTISTPTSNQYLLAYWPQLDEINHLLGPSCHEASEHLVEIDSRLQMLVEDLKGTNTKIIITSDHGFNDVPKENQILTQDYPEFTDSLILPLCGDTRSAFCYIRPKRTHEFEKYVERNLSDICDLFVSEDLIAQHWFGQHTMNPKLPSRVGDYTLICKENFAIINSYPGIETPNLLGHHGGSSSDEMLVPLIVYDC
ncbi:MAG: alkaline phosphatase family protein [Candidatus Thorarchaeota archaeon]|nr:alkaline phosphatase family protein [Candidatus Thorarchaeota archaeon]